VQLGAAPLDEVLPLDDAAPELEAPELDVELDPEETCPDALVDELLPLEFPEELAELAVASSPPSPGSCTSAGSSMPHATIAALTPAQANRRGAKK
jgi:hypothetical protein